jgi:hypothetical protein
MAQTEIPMFVTRVAEVWAVFRRHRVANLELCSKELHLPKNQITGRIHDLMECNPQRLQECATKELCPLSGRRTKFWRAI